MSRICSSEWRLRVALVAGGLGLGAYVVAATVSPPGADLTRHVVLFLVSFVLYLWAVFAVLARGDVQKGGRSRRWLMVALVWAVVLRVVMITTTPSLSDDVFRYVWDGKVAAAGIDPYRYPPSAAELSGLRDPLWNGINAKTMVTPYPPLAEGLFALVYRLAPDSPTAMQVLAVAFDLGVLVLLLLMLGRLGMDRYRILIYAWNPLVLVQFAHSGHFDASMILPLLGAIYLASFGRRVASGVLLGISILVKLVPAMVAPLFVPMWGLAGLAGVGATVGLGILPFLGSPALAGLFSEASDARFNDSGGYLLTRLFGLVSPNSDALARYSSGLVLVAVSVLMAVAVWRRKAGWKVLLTGVYVLIGLFLALNAVVEPWYLTWMVPFLCFILPPVRGRFGWLSPSWGWLLLSGTITLTDLTYLPATGNSAWIWVRMVEYAPLYALLLLWVYRRSARKVLPAR